MSLRFAIVLGILVLTILSGCAAKDDLNRARAVVETSLEAWKSGADPKTLASQDIEFLDPDWQAGHRLKSYSVKSAASQPQQGPRVVVVLDLESKSGKKMPNTEVAYEVILNKTAKIGRDAFHVAGQ